jgi:hypothetical protein
VRKANPFFAAQPAWAAARFLEDAESRAAQAPHAKIESAQVSATDASRFLLIGENFVD